MADARCLIFLFEINKVLKLIFSLIPYVECNSIRNSIKDNLISEIPSNEKFISFPGDPLVLSVRVSFKENIRLR